MKYGTQPFMRFQNQPLEVIGKFSIVALGEKNKFDIKPKEPNIKLQTPCLFRDKSTKFLQY